METKIYKTPAMKRLFQFAFPVGLVILNFLDRPSSIAHAERIAENSPLFCIFHKLSGWLCPGCGMTRSLLCFFTGQFEMSFYFNPFGPLVALALISIWILTFTMNGNPHIWEQHKRATSYSLVIVLLWGIMRNWPAHYFFLVN